MHVTTTEIKIYNITGAPEAYTASFSNHYTWQLTTLLTYVTIRVFWAVLKLFTNRILNHGSFYACLLLPDVLILRSSHVVAGRDICLFQSLLWVYHTVFIYSAVDRCLDCFQFLTIINNDAVNVFFRHFGEHVCTSSVWYIHGLCGSQNSVVIPSDPCLCPSLLPLGADGTCGYEEISLPWWCEFYSKKDFADVIKATDQLTLRLGDCSGWDRPNQGNTYKGQAPLPQKKRVWGMREHVMGATWWGTEGSL